ncbi:hypothetical protein DPMN_095045 [Dreissena polymorpha]|uniref:Apple domain-containing protein n=1 Tax=Dreissena polymorpha TaxID=45954 RepID=A0A9D4L6U2_DREPO|nr:hypothetical protein DPMN_095045 [Dreissena polymorpha]
MYEVEEARDKIIEGAFVWDVTTFSLLSCFRKCLEHDDCVAFGWQPMAKQCKGFRNITALYSPASPIKSQLYCT